MPGTFTKAVLAGLLWVSGLAFGQSGYLGLQLADVDAARAARLHLKEITGVEVTAVLENGPAEHSGIEVGDALLAYNGETILGGQQLLRLVAETPVGRRVRIDYWRHARMHSTLVGVGTLPPITRILNGNSAGTATFDVPDVAPPSLSDFPAALLVWRNGMLGIECEELSPQMAETLGITHGLLVRWVQRGGSGAASGLRAGDVLLGIDNRDLATPRDLSSYFRSLAGASSDVSGAQNVGHRPFSLAVLRDRKNLTLHGSLPE